MSFASLCVLSFNRKKYLERSLETLWANTKYPYELIVLDDGSSERAVQEYIFQLARAKKVSTILMNTDHNMGIGIAVNRGFQIARGDYLFKLDADLDYKPGWLEHCVQLLEKHPLIGCMGLFKYWHRPCNFPDELIQTHEDYHEVIDFVGSAIGMRREVYDEFGLWYELQHSFGEDKQFKVAVGDGGFQMALPLEDVAVNFGFGEQHSSLIKEIDWEGHKHTYNVPTTTPLLFGGQ